MGQNKSTLNLGDRTVIEHVSRQIQTYDEWFVIANDIEHYHFLDCPLYSDRYTEQGPLAGIEAALTHSSFDVSAVTACDTPFVDRRVYNLLLEQMSGYDAVIPVFNERMHPLSGVYNKSALPVIRKQLEDNNRKIRSFFKYVDVHYVSDFPGIPQEIVEWHFFNMNTPEEYDTALSKMKL